VPSLKPPSIRRNLDEREAKLDELYCRWNDVTPLLRGSISTTEIGSGEAGCSLMPLAWNLSYRKLEVLHRYMVHVAETGSPEFKGMHAHLCEWYGRGRWRREKEKRVDKFTKKQYEAEAMVFHGGKHANPHRVLEALEWISGHFPGEVYLPDEFIKAA